MVHLCPVVWKMVEVGSSISLRVIDRSAIASCLKNQESIRQYRWKGRRLAGMRLKSGIRRKQKAANAKKWKFTAKTTSPIPTVGMVPMT